MNIMDMVLGEQNASAINQMAKSLGLGTTETKNVVEQLLPVLSRGLQRNTTQEDGMEALVRALSSGNHQRYIDQSEVLTLPDTVEDGNSILGHIFGSKDVSRNVAAYAEKQTGVSSSIIKKMLPMVAALAMGALGKRASSGGLFRGAGRVTKQNQGLIRSFIDSDHDGSIADDLLSMAVKLI